MNTISAKAIIEYMQDELAQLKANMQDEMSTTATAIYYHFLMVCNDLGIIKPEEDAQS